MTKHVATIGIDYGVKPVNVGGQMVRVNFWDMAGGEEYYEIRNEFYRDAQVCGRGREKGREKGGSVRDVGILSEGERLRRRCMRTRRRRRGRGAAGGGCG